ncbi:MAG: bifunctional [glutamate--ammonia ligase]-adenylyl-L-tyrosine phosphorylase/[glutamate--ammonia-ligase] adenylyltransferase [Pseudomonadales bacterium]|jgi:glutamate-ammonia-ligase adenylyltransferase|nr:bifunctional [glutamate--ammonia ligase]-adenylyl-L-tyrosine phosphorylase/[glutamate--ammonia-ligase] adenylyltransferase [Pseudomonadales bacterium]
MAVTTGDPALDTLLNDQRTRFQEVLSAEPQLHAHLAAHGALQDELERLWLGSDYAFTLCRDEPALLLDLLQSGDLERRYEDWDARLAHCVARVGEEHGAVLERLKKQLRHFRKREYLRILWRDLNGKAGLFDTTGDLSQLADACLRYAIAALTPEARRLHGIPYDANGREQQLIVLAMGKYGAYELNLSSDIDLIFVFPEDGETTVTPEFQRGAPLAQVSTAQQYFCKLGQLLTQALDTVNADGFVFRVDLRLRPYGSHGVLALSVNTLEEYYLAQGRDWERFAMIKARAVTGDADTVAYLMQVLHAFTYRRYLDFATIAALRELKAQIEQQVRRKGLRDNIKLGNGGIREIEFIVQVLQLIFGGRRQALQQNALLGAMHALVSEGLLPAEDAQELQDAYCFLRKLEHAIQGLYDKQTQLYPDNAQDELRCAFALGFADAPALRQRLEQVRATVATHFSQLIAEPQTSRGAAEEGELKQLWLGTLDGERAAQLLQTQGFDNAQDMLDVFKRYRESRQFLSLDATSRQRMDRFMPLLLARLRREARPGFAFTRVFPFVQAVAQRTAYLVLLMESAVALNQLVLLCVQSSWVQELLCRYPVLLDELLRPLQQPPARQELHELLQRQLLRIDENEAEEQLSAIQLFKQEQTLVVAASELSGTLPLMKVSDALSWLAETVLQAVLALAWRQLTARYGEPVNANGQSGTAEFLIIAYGKLGGIELSYGSDLDLVFVHDADPEQETTGGGTGRRINSAAFYAQLGQKILSLLGTSTFTGKLYEIDLRLRPSGSSGALVSNLAAFAQYQEQQAWTWEHQALVRARVVAGSSSLARRFDSLREAVLRLPRDPVILARDIVSMRHKMRQQLGSKTDADKFKIKQDAGGLVDIEFIVQYLTLRHGAQHPGLLRWPDNMRLLDEAAAAGVLSAADAQTLQTIYLEYRALLHREVLDNTPETFGSDAFAEQRAKVTAIWNELFANIEPGELSHGRGVEGRLPA